MKVFYVMGIGTARIGQTLSIANKILPIYGEGYPTIGPSLILVIYETLRDNVLVKNLTPEDVQKGFTNRHAVDQNL